MAQQAGVRCHLTTGATLIPCRDAEPFLAACLDSGVGIAGVEGFDLVNESRRPDMGAILDLSTVTDPAGAVEEARRFVGSVCRPGLFLEFDLLAP